MTQPFATAELKDELERTLGFALASLDRLDGASALNFRAVRASDGLVFAVKCSPPFRRVMHEHLVRHLDEMRGTKAVRRLFAREAPATFRGFDVVCLAWCAGERRFPDTLTDEELLRFLDDYLDFSAAMQRATLVNPHDPNVAWRRETLANCSGFWGRPIRRLVERELPEEEVDYRPDATRTVHGDFHHGNFLFAEGRVSGYFDLEEFCQGYPADDLVRYFVCAAEHLRWYEMGRLRRLLEHFAVAVAHMPWPSHEWRVALNALLLRKVHAKTADGAVGPFQMANLLFRARLYRKMKLLVNTYGDTKK